VHDAAAQAGHVDVALDFWVRLDPARTVFFRQSDVPRCTTGVLLSAYAHGAAGAMPLYKDKIAKGSRRLTGSSRIRS
jgi:tryptophanyl-tRNA synthetase